MSSSELITDKVDWQAVKVGETVKICDTRDEASSKDGYLLEFERLSESEADRQLSEQPSLKGCDKNSNHVKEIGNKCPRCKGIMKLQFKYSTSDGMYGYDRDTCLCQNPTCGMRRYFDFCGYGYPW